MYCRRARSVFAPTSPIAPSRALADAPARRGSRRCSRIRSTATSRPWGARGSPATGQRSSASARRRFSERRPRQERSANETRRGRFRSYSPRTQGVTRPPQPRRVPLVHGPFIWAIAHIPIPCVRSALNVPAGALTSDRRARSPLLRGERLCPDSPAASPCPR